jgi:hypothetical protein
LLVAVAVVGTFATWDLHQGCTGLEGDASTPFPGTSRAHWCDHFDKLDGWILTFAALALASLAIALVRRKLIPSLVMCVLAVIAPLVVAAIANNLNAIGPT